MVSGNPEAYCLANTNIPMNSSKNSLVQGVSPKETIAVMPSNKELSPVLPSFTYPESHSYKIACMKHISVFEAFLMYFLWYPYNCPGRLASLFIYCIFNLPLLKRGQDGVIWLPFFMSQTTLFDLDEAWICWQAQDHLMWIRHAEIFVHSVQHWSIRQLL